MKKLLGVLLLCLCTCTLCGCAETQYTQDEIDLILEANADYISSLDIDSCDFILNELQGYRVQMHREGYPSAFIVYASKTPRFELTDIDAQAEEMAAIMTSAEFAKMKEYAAGILSLIQDCYSLGQFAERTNDPMSVSGPQDVILVLKEDVLPMCPLFEQKNWSRGSITLVGGDLDKPYKSITLYLANEINNYVYYSFGQIS